MTKARWIVGLNMPGYMPDNDPAGYPNWNEAHAALLSELDHSADCVADTDADALVAIEATITRAKDIRKYSEFGETSGQYHYWLVRA
jgi:hypothetical protein